MKILHVYKDFDPPIHGGMERHIALMCQFQRQWAPVEALVCSRSRRTRVVEQDGTRLTKVGEWGRFQGAPLAPSFPWHMRRLKADVVVVHVPNPTAEIGYLLGRPSGRLVVRYHSDVVRQAVAMKFYKPVLMNFLRKADMILPTSAAYLDTSQTLQLVRERCRVVPLGILPEAFQSPDPNRVTALRKQYGGDFVLFSGKHRYYKGLPYLIEAARRITSHVVIAGDGPERRRCIALAKGIGVNVTFPGALSQEELVAHLNACAVFAFPSVERSEAFGVSVMEAHACGKPVVATKLGTGVEFINQDGETGINVPPRDAHALAEALNALLADPTRRIEMGTAAKCRIEADFHPEKVAEAEFALYQRVVEC